MRLAEGYSCLFSMDLLPFPASQKMSAFELMSLPFSLTQHGLFPLLDEMRLWRGGYI